MFGRSSSNRAPARQAVPSIVGADLRISGDLSSDGEVHVEGGIDGDVRCRVIIIGEGGSVTGAIEAERAVVRGGVTGRITARTVELARTARIIGDIAHDSLEIEAGAQFEGNARPLTGASAIAAAPALILDRRVEEGPSEPRPPVESGASG